MLCKFQATEVFEEMRKRAREKDDQSQSKTFQHAYQQACYAMLRTYLSGEDLDAFKELTKRMEEEGIELDDSCHDYKSQLLFRVGEGQTAVDG